jgi:hypothetical protein
MTIRMAESGELVYLLPSAQIGLRLEGESPAEPDRLSGVSKGRESCQSAR